MLKLKLSVIGAECERSKCNISVFYLLLFEGKTNHTLTSHAIEIESFAEFIANDESHRFRIFQLL